MSARMKWWPHPANNECNKGLSFIQNYIGDISLCLYAAFLSVLYRCQRYHEDEMASDAIIFT